MSRPAGLDHLERAIKGGDGDGDGDGEMGDADGDVDASL